ncbi:hypothetical protein GQ53DRAFT_817033 [Thozetella sp. PMI_491]|nr:hypothetical protein GQ53DRAFT_817033 [Thozetella sp. PMI_491]
MGVEKPKDLSESDSEIEKGTAFDSPSSRSQDNASLETQRLRIDSTPRRGTIKFLSVNTRRQIAYYWAKVPTEWTWEAFTCLWSVLALIAVVATLRSHEHLPLPEWPLQVSINALLSLYSLMFKSCVTLILQSCIGQLSWLWFESKRPLLDASRYDAAGRGAWGAAQWLWKYHIRHPLVALGSILFIVSIAVDPSFQQVVRHSDCSVPLLGGQPATMARTNYIDAAQLYSPQAFATLALRDLLPAVQSSLNAGIFSPMKPLQGSCSTGNCTFPVFSSAGYCSSCEDVSGELQFTYRCNSTQGPNWVGGDEEACNSTESADAIIVSSLPTGTNMVWNETFYQSSNTLTGNISVSGNTYKPRPFDIIMGKTYFSENKLSPMTGEAVTDCEGTNPSDWRCRGYGAASCMMYPCVRTYNISINAGIISETINQTTLDTLRSIPYWNASSDSYGKNVNWTDFVIVDMECLTDSEKSVLAKAGHDTDKSWTAMYMPPGVNLSAPAPSNPSLLQSLVARQCAYAFNGQIDYALWNLFRESSFMIGTVYGSMERTLVHPMKLISFGGSRDLQVLYNSSDISFAGIQSTFNNVTSSFTAYIRSNGHGNYSTPATGVLLHYAVCLNVDWVWITLPVILDVGVIVLLVMTITVSARKNLPIWKASCIPLVLRGPFSGKQGSASQSGSELSQLQHSNSISIIEKEANSYIVYLDNSSEKCRFIAALP